MSNKSIWLVIPAAGVGKRMQAQQPKQYLQLLGKTVLEQTLACFNQVPNIAGAVVAIAKDDPYWDDLQWDTLSFPVYRAEGGKERADSVLNGLNYLHQELQIANDHLVWVHDAARPCLDKADIERLWQVDASSGALLAMPVSDTMKRAQSNQSVSHTEERDGLWHALTPQASPLGLLQAALTQALHKGVNITDESSALEWAGYAPQLVEGSASNIKITRPADLALAEFFLSQRRS